MDYRLQLRKWIAEDTYEVDGALFWRSNDAAVPLSSFRDAGLPAPARQAEAVDKHTRETIEQYKAAQARRTPEEIAEQRAEARAAFGPGEEVVNVLTGERYTT